MKGYRVSEARARFGDLLDQAEGGQVVIIERHGVQFSLKAEGVPKQRKSQGPSITWAHPAVLSGDWTWDMGAQGLQFRARKTKA